MAVINTDFQDIEYKKKIKNFYKYSKSCKGKGKCPVQDMLAPSSDKWSLFVIYNLAYNETLRFNQLKKYIPAVSSRMLSVTLKRLELSGIINRKAYAEVPPKVEYKLTSFGYEFSKKLIELNLWMIEFYPLFKDKSIH
jgi:DNA-binding HxlR family transcriptional regulator